MSRKLRTIAIAIVGAVVLFLALFSFPPPPRAPVCSDEWMAEIERDYVQTSDREGHGPDPGDSEWYREVESGFHMEPLSTNDHQEHCRAVAKQITGHRYIRNRLLGLLFRVY